MKGGRLHAARETFPFACLPVSSGNKKPAETFHHVAPLPAAPTRERRGARAFFRGLSGIRFSAVISSHTPGSRCLPLSPSSSPGLALACSAQELFEKADLQLAHGLLFFTLGREKTERLRSNVTLNVKDIFSKYLFPGHLWPAKLSVLKISRLLKVHWMFSSKTLRCFVWSPL